MPNSLGTNGPWAKHQMQLDPPTFNKFYKEDTVLSAGADGIVSKYQHRRVPTRFVAVKTTFEAVGSRGHRHQTQALVTEIDLLRRLKSPHIVSLLGWDVAWQNIKGNPAAYYEFCELGDVDCYQQKVREVHGRVPEMTVWQFFKHMSLGLNHLHHEQNPPLCHADLKSLNVLVQRPANAPADEVVPLLPIFKIADFGRCMEYHPRHQKTSKNEWHGTPEFAPPMAEREASQATPAMDIYSLGASIQHLALGIHPVQSKAAFIAEFLKDTGIDLAIADPPVNFRHRDWRAMRPTKYRPLNVTLTRMKTMWDWPDDKPDPTGTFSSHLNRWYTRCWTKDPAKRVTARYLVKFVPLLADKMIGLEQKSISLIEGQLLDARERWKTFQEDAAKEKTAAQALDEIVQVPPVPPRPAHKWWEFEPSPESSPFIADPPPSRATPTGQPIPSQSQVQQKAKVYDLQVSWSERLREARRLAPGRPLKPEDADELRKKILQLPQQVQEELQIEPAEAEEIRRKVLRETQGGEQERQRQEAERVVPCPPGRSEQGLWTSPTPPPPPPKSLAEPGKPRRPPPRIWLSEAPDGDPTPSPTERVQRPSASRPRLPRVPRPTQEEWDEDREWRRSRKKDSKVEFRFLMGKPQ